MLMFQMMGTGSMALDDKRFKYDTMAEFWKMTKMVYLIIKKFIFIDLEIVSSQTRSFFNRAWLINCIL